MRHINTIIHKQLKDTLKNNAVLIQFIMFPLMGIIMCRTINFDNMPMPENFFANMFATMYIGMAPLVSVSAIIAEEKEKNTLRVLMMADVSPAQYLIGIGIYVFAACILGCVIFCFLLTNVTGIQRLTFLLIAASGIITSILIGAAIGIGSKNQMSATAVSVPVMMVFSFMPMLSMFNDKIEKISKLMYSGQIHILMDNLKNGGNYAQNYFVIGINITIFAILFYVLYNKRNGMID